MRGVGTEHDHFAVAAGQEGLLRTRLHYSDHRDFDRPFDLVQRQCSRRVAGNDQHLRAL